MTGYGTDTITSSAAAASELLTPMTRPGLLAGHLDRDELCSFRATAPNETSCPDAANRVARPRPWGPVPPRIPIFTPTPGGVWRGQAAWRCVPATWSWAR